MFQIKIKMMVKKLFLMAILAAFFVSCGNNAKENNKEEKQAMKVADFLKKQSELVGKEILIEGTVTHTCAHGGKKLFIMGEDPEKTVKVTAGEGIAKFDKELEGSMIKIKGTVEELKVDEAYLAEWEAELAEADTTHADTTEHEHKSGTKSEDFHHGEGNKQIESMRKKLEESGKDHLSFYSVECTKYDVVEEEEKEEKE